MVVGTKEGRKPLPLARIGIFIVSYCIVKKGVFQVEKNSFWMTILCVLLVVSVSAGMSIPLRVAIGGCALVILCNVIRKGWRLCHE